MPLQQLTALFYHCPLLPVLHCLVCIISTFFIVPGTTHTHGQLKTTENEDREEEGKAGT